MHEITVQELAKLLANNDEVIILDVRNEDEYAFCNLKGLLIPLRELPDRLHELDKTKTIVVHCHAGGRSKKATEFLQASGFEKAVNLKGGITAWANEIDPSMPTY
jgi:rhodanese-related sulfurtransferase